MFKLISSVVLLVCLLLSGCGCLNCAATPGQSPSNAALQEQRPIIVFENVSPYPYPYRGFGSPGFAIVILGHHHCPPGTPDFSRFVTH